MLTIAKGKVYQSMKIKLAENFWYAAGEDGAIHAVDTEEQADTFKTMGDASKALEKARKYQAFKNAEIVEDLF